MALLPNPNEIQRVQPRPSQAVVGVDTRLVGEAPRVLGNTVTDLANREIDRLDELKVSDAETQLMRKELELTEAYKKVQGGDVLSPDFHKNSQDQYATEASAILDGLSTPSQKAKFQALMKRRSVSFDANRVSHAMGEADRFETQQHESRLQVLIDRGAAQYANPAEVSANAMALNDEIVKWGVKKGMSDPAIAAEYAKKVNGAYYTTLINQAIANEDNSTANTLFAASRQFMTPEQAKSIQGQLKVGNDFTEGQVLVSKAQEMLTEGKALTEVETYLRTSAKTPGAYSAAQAMFTNYLQATDKAQKEAVGTVIELYHTSGSDAGAMARMVNSAEFKRLTPTQQNTARDYMDADVYQDVTRYRAGVTFAQSQADRRDAKANKFNSNDATAMFYRYVSDPKLKAMTPQQLYGLAPEIGIDKVEKLLSVKKNLEAGAAPIKLDKALVDAAMPADLKKDSKTAKKDAYLGFVQEAAMEWQSANPGKTPTLEDQKAIARSANAQFTLPGRVFGTNTYSTGDTNIPNTAESRAKRDIIKAATAKGKTLTPEQVDAVYRRSLQQPK